MTVTVTETNFLKLVMIVFILLYIVIIIHCIRASIFDYEVIDGEGNTISLSKYQDKKVIIIGNFITYFISYLKFSYILILIMIMKMTMMMMMMMIMI